jgi:hypothetical protein
MRELRARLLAVSALAIVAACGLDLVGTGGGTSAEPDAASSVDGAAPPPPGDDTGALEGGGEGGGDPGDSGVGAPCARSDGGVGISCGGACVDPASDRAHCGACATACSAAEACEGKCVVVAAAVVAFRQEIPCTNDASPACSNALSTPDKTITITGTPGTSYDITVRIRGVLEQRTYPGATTGTATGTNASFWAFGGTEGPVDTWNIYDLEITDPAFTWHLNAGASGHTYADGIDYKAVFRAKAGSKVTIHADSIDLAQARNRDPAGNAIIVPGIAPAPLPFYGQFTQIDVESVSVAP